MSLSSSIAAIPFWKRWFCKPIVNVQLGETAGSWSRAPLQLRSPSDQMAIEIEVDGYGQLYVNGQFQTRFNGFHCFELKATGGSQFDVKVSNSWGKSCLDFNVPERNIPRSNKYIGIGVITNPVHLRSEPTVSRSVIRDEGVFLYDVQPGIRVVNTSAQTCSPVQINNYRNLQPNLSVIRLDDILDDVTHEISQRGLRT
jgi:hypothetical protein